MRLLFAFLIVLGVAACENYESPCRTEEPTQSPAFKVLLGAETQITTNTSNQLHPKIAGDHIVWTDNRNGPHDIYLYDLGTDTEAQITNKPSTEIHPSVSGHRVVWEDYNVFGSGPHIFTYDLNTGTESQITTGVAAHHYPAISGDRVVWHDDRNGNRDIYLYDLGATPPSEIRITADPADQHFAAISGDRIVWEDTRNGGWDIYMYDLRLGTETRITDGSAVQIASTLLVPKVRIAGDLIVWMDYRDGDADVYMYDISTGTEVALATGPARQQWPVISGYRIVWTDDRNGIDWDIYMYDLAEGLETQITQGFGDQSNPTISGDRIAWHDRRDGNFDIFMVEFATEPTAGVQLVDSTVEDFVIDGSVDNVGVAEVLGALLAQTDAALARGNANAAANTLNAFLRQVEAQSGHHITAEAAETLVDMVQVLLGQIGT